MLLTRACRFMMVLMLLAVGISGLACSDLQRGHRYDVILDMAFDVADEVDSGRDSNVEQDDGVEVGDAIWDVIGDIDAGEVSDVFRDISFDIDFGDSADEADVADATRDIGLDADVMVFPDSSGDIVQADEGVSTRDPGTDICVPQCDGRDCGDDLCGGLCGTCIDGKQCVVGTCSCVAEDHKACCGDTVCWFDSCDAQGVKTTDCPYGCNPDAAICRDCVGDCSGKDCGDDGCGLECGLCTKSACDLLIFTPGQTCFSDICTGDRTPQNCNDGNVCTTDLCDPSGGCANTNNTLECAAATCESGIFHAAVTCFGGACPSQTEVACDDGKYCTDDTCDVGAGCSSALLGGYCLIDGTCHGDGQASVSDVCQVCTVLASTTDWSNATDGTDCTEPSCSELTFTAGKTCASGACTGGGGTQDCYDGKTCTNDSCSTGGCSSVLQDSHCLIAGTCYLEGASKGSDSCQVCTSTLSTTSWSNAIDGTSCGIGGGCVLGLCCMPDDHKACSGGNVYWHDSCGNEGALAQRCQSGCTAGVCDPSGGCPLGYILVPSGMFTMGSPTTEPAHSLDETEHQVTFSQSFCLKVSEVTQGEWQALMGNNPSGFSTCGSDCPVDTVSWWDSVAYCNQLSSSQGLTQCYSLTGCTGTPGVPGYTCTGVTFAGLTCTGYRLPTESEWEYAARAGTTTGTYLGTSTLIGSEQPNAALDSIAWFGGNSSGKTHVGKGKTPNEWGLYDILGNVVEWTGDYYGAYPGTVTDPTGAASGPDRVLRGGFWGDDARYARAAYRYYVLPGFRNDALGLRPSRSTCGGIACPTVPGYTAVCNAQEHCEYANVDPTGWKQWDVWVLVPPGSFTMGSPSTESPRNSTEEPNHVVTFASGYLMAKYEVTVLQYDACQAASPGTCTPPSTVDWAGAQGTNTSANGRSAHPQNGLTWAQAGAVCEWMGGRRPSEAQWEYAATGPTHRKFPWGDTPEPTCANDTANFYESSNGCGTGGTLAAGVKTAGVSFSGALDMAGNVWEWVEDWYHSDYGGAPTDGSAWVSPIGVNRLLRGGSFDSVAADLRLSNRASGGAERRDANVGARCTRPLPCGNDLQPGYCLIGGICYGDGQASAADVCRVCESSASASAFSNATDGTDCAASSCSGLTFSAARTCVSGACTGGSGTLNCDDGKTCTTDTCTASGCSSVLQAGQCLIAGTCYANGAANGTDLCQVCDTTQSTTAWSNANDGTSCGIGGGCQIGTCCTPDDHKACSGGNVYWYDSCGKQGSLAQTCQYGCSAGECYASNQCPTGYVLVPSGTFTMGSPTTEPDRFIDETEHQVTISKPFCLKETEVTQGEWQALMGNNPSYFSTCGSDCPVETVSWWDSVAYCNQLSSNQGLTLCYTLTGCSGTPGVAGYTCTGVTFAGLTCTGYRLPTESEWEYAARAGTTTGTYNGTSTLRGSEQPNTVLDSIAWFSGNSGSKTHIVKGKTPNAWGLYDMLGHVSEWTWDWSGDYPGTVTDPTGVPTGSVRAHRGACWGNFARYIRAALRGSAGQDARGTTLGLRPSRSTCGGIICPMVPGYTPTCNSQAHCEYANIDTTGWKQWDVWVFVPPGSFTMGSPSTEFPRNASEDPEHTVSFASGYLIGKYGVTVNQYEACQAASPGTCTPPSTQDWGGTQGTNTTANGRSAHPQNGLTWAQAGAVCSWMGGRRPSEAEWEYAATGPSHRKYPWGDMPAPTCANTTAVFNEVGLIAGDGCSTGGTLAAGTKTAGASWSGALDMAGNVWEWAEDWYHLTYAEAPTDGSAWVLPTGTYRVIRGGGFGHDASNLRSSYRTGGVPDVRSADRGARCMRPLP